MKFKELPKEEKPREKLLKVGKENLTNVELLSIILKTGTKELDVVDLSIKLLNNYNINYLKEISIEELTSIKGIGKVKAIELLATIELGKRIILSNEEKLIKLNNPQVIYNHCRYLFIGKKQELFYCLYFNNKQELISKKLLFIGTINQSITHPREIFKEAYKLSASSIICIHNHPSNDLNPSVADIEFTKNIVSAGNFQAIPINDHIIIGNNGYYSFFENGLIKQ